MPGTPFMFIEFNVRGRDKFASTILLYFECFNNNNSWKRVFTVFKRFTARKALKIDPTWNAVVLVQAGRGASHDTGIKLICKIRFGLGNFYVELFMFLPCNKISPGAVTVWYIPKNKYHIYSSTVLCFSGTNLLRPNYWLLPEDDTQTFPTNPRYLS